MTTASLTARMQFVVEIARRLHQYGTSAPRLEAAIDSISARLGLNCHSLSTPTSILFSFTSREHGDNALAEVTQVIRVSPGQDDLRSLSEANEIADRVIDGVLDIDEGSRLLREISDRRSGRDRALEALSYGIAAAAVAAILKTSWADLIAAGAIGTAVGVLAVICELRPRLRLSLEAISGFMATLAATLISVYVVPLTLQSVVLASVIVLLPGLTLTTAVRELSTQHLVSGVARFAGAVATLIKLAFGTIAAHQLCKSLQLIPEATSLTPIPDWAQWVALVFGCFSFAVLFRSARRDISLFMAAAALGYLITYYGSREFTPQFGVFLAGLAMGALSNLFTRVSRRPAALVRLPGIILLVPGSVGFLSLSLLGERDLPLGISMAVSLIGILTCLVAGLLFGDLIVPSRRIL